MSFVNMLSNDIWTEQDITNRTEAMVRAVISVQDELVLNRKIQGASLNKYQLTQDDINQMTLLEQAGYQAQQEGIAAREDMATLLQVFEVESAKNRLALPITEPELDEEGNILNQDQIDIDNQERTDAQNIVDSAPEEVLYWVNIRNPEPPVVEEPIIVEDPIVE